MSQGFGDSKIPRILLIDDNQDDRVLVIRELRREFSHLQIEEAIDAKSFERALTHSNFDLAITDYRLLWTDGISILREIKARHPNCPTIMFTDSGSQEIAVEAMKAGLDDYLTKSPKHYIRLPLAVRSLLQRTESQQRADCLEIRLQTLLNQLNVGVFRATLDGRLLEGNAAFLQILGVNSLQAAQAQSWPQLLKQVDAVRECLNPTCELKFYRDNGSSIWISWSQRLSTIEVEPLLEGLIEDITERKLAQLELERRVVERTKDLQEANEQLLAEMRSHQQAQLALQESEQRYRQLVELSPDAILIQSGGRLVFVNSSAVKLYGAKSQFDLIGRSLLDLIHPHYQEIVKAQILNEEKEIAPSEQKSLKLDGTAIDVEMAAAPLIYQNKSAAQIVVRDITLRKQGELKLRKALEEERELNELKSRIITTVSHEYRTPLAIIQTSADLLEKYPQKLTPEKKQAYFHRIQDGIKHLADLVSDVLLVSQAEVNSLEFHPTPLDLYQFCQEVVNEMLSGRTGQIAIAVNSRSCLTNVCLDRKLLRQILTNLLSNGLKYSPKGGKIELELECDRQNAILTLEDRGIGIPEADKPRLFEAFHRASNVGTIPGTGLGLSIVKQCVDLHGGKISVESTVGVGTKFTVYLPIQHQE